MGKEVVFYRNYKFYEYPDIISRVQKFLWKYLQQYDHPKWFQEMLADINANSITPIPKYFFDEEEVDMELGRKNYIINMLEQSITEMERMNMSEFIYYIKDDMRRTYYDYDPKYTILDDDVYKNHYLRIIRNVRDMMNGTFKPEEF